jgi:hypothetical protein
MEKNKPHFNVVIATPGNSFTPGYMRSILLTVYTLNNEGLTWNFLNHGGSLVAMARETTIGGWDTNNIKMTQPCSGEFTYDKIIWIDSDIEWDVADFFKLYNSKKDIISGCYLMEDRHIPIYNQPRGGMMPEDMLLSRTEPFKVAGAGFGFIAVKSGVFEKMPRPWFGPVSIPNTDENKDVSPEFVLIGEDLSWCTKAIKCGYDIWVDPKVRVTHQKTFKLYWKDVLQQQQMLQEKKDKK